jgi:thiosulfate/3-mercaptopyruvate sulfurtransferase
MVTPLITARELSKLVGRDDVRIVDCRWYLDAHERGPILYREGHLPGAAYASLDGDLTAPVGPGRHPLPPPEQFARTIERLGITPETSVVVYDDMGGAFAVRLWWMLTDQGHERTQVLDGGIQAWTSLGLGLETDIPEPARGGMDVGPWRRVVDRDTVEGRAPGVIVVDSRTADRYRGEVEPIDPIAGHIPGAVSAPHPGNLTDELTLLPSDDLRDRFTRIGATDPDNVIVYCGSGVTSCHNILAMELAGIGRPWLYEGSWSDWCTSDMPIATGPTP